MKRNYHTHNMLCGHAQGSIEDYVKAACNGGLEELGLSDHIPFPDDHLPDRMPYSEFRNYLDTIGELQHKYKNKIKLYCGAEAEYLPDLDSYYKKLLTDGTLEYLLLGQHYFIDNHGRLVDVFQTLSSSDDAVMYAKTAMEGMSTGYFSYLAHPDLFMIGGWTPDKNTDKACDIILNEAAKHDYILELNANGLRHRKVAYPSRYFWEKASGSDIRVIIGADAHSPEALCDDAVRYCENLAAELKLNIIDTPF